MTDVSAPVRADRGRRVWTQVLCAAIVAGLILLGLAQAAFAPDDDIVTDKTAWSAWNLTPDIVIATGLVLAIYINGMRRRRASGNRAPMSRHLLFFAGMACLFLALQSPIDALADRLFLMHQVQHLLLRMMGPMLLALSWPEARLTAGLPRTVRTNALAPMASNRAVQELFGVLGHPAIATILFVAALYVWQVPRIHDYALRNEDVHYVMHITMLVAGLLFWWLIFDRRPPKSALDMDDHDLPWWRVFGRRSPHGLRYGVRIMMLWLVILSNILLGAVTAIKGVELYPAYDDPGRLFGYTPMADEQVGGFIIWMPSSMMCILAVLIVLHMLGLFETRLDERRRIQPGSNAIALLYPTTAAELIARARPRNRAMALAFSIFVASVFTTVMMIGILDYTSHNGGLHALQPSGRGPRLARVADPVSKTWTRGQAIRCGNDCARAVSPERGPQRQAPA